MPFIETGASGRIPFRKMFNNKADAMLDFNKYKRFSNIYHSVYWFREAEDKIDAMGNYKRTGPNYNTAIIDKIVFDLDSYKTTKINDHIEEIYTDEGLESIRKFRDWCEKHNYLRSYVHSGGGFYGILNAVGNPLKLRDAMLQITQETGMATDPATIGDTSRMMRVINSYNFGDHRKCYAVPLTEEELDLSYRDIHALAVKPRFRKHHQYGHNTFSLESYNIDKAKILKKELFINLTKNEDANKILSTYGWKTEDFCDPIKHILSMPYIGHYLRYELIKYFRSIVNMEIGDCVNLMASLLKEEGIHSFAEGQAKHVYKYNRVFNPKKFKAMGYCPLQCYKCIKIRKII